MLLDLHFKIPSFALLNYKCKFTQPTTRGSFLLVTLLGAKCKASAKCETIAIVNLQCQPSLFVNFHPTLIHFTAASANILHLGGGGGTTRGCAGIEQGPHDYGKVQ